MRIVTAVLFLIPLLSKTTFCERNARILEIPIDLETSIGLLDPFKWIFETKLNFDKLKTPNLARGLFILDDILLAGFSSGKGTFEVTDRFKGITNLSWEENITVSSSYFAKMVILDMFRTSGEEGEMTFALENMNLNCLFNIHSKGPDKPIQVSAINNFQLSGTAKMQLTGFLGDNVLSQMVADEIADIVNLFLESDILNTMAKRYLPTVLNILFYLFNVNLNSIKL